MKEIVFALQREAQENKGAADSTGGRSRADPRREEEEVYAGA